jgi:hypothetical protein
MSGKIPDIDVFTSVKAKKMKFGKVPKTRHWFEGDPGHESRSKVVKENLPDEVEPGVTYRDVKVEWTAVSRIVHPTDEADDGADEES